MIWSHISIRNILKIQTIKNTTSRIATDWALDTNIQHLHNETHNYHYTQLKLHKSDKTDKTSPTHHLSYEAYNPQTKKTDYNYKRKH